MPAYLDTSAFVKLIRSEPESRALRGELSDGELISSALLSVEGRRAAARYGELAAHRARIALTTITLIPIDEPLLDDAADIPPQELRSLDALHLATARSLGDELDQFYCYDDRLSSAAIILGIPVSSPS